MQAQPKFSGIKPPKFNQKKPASNQPKKKKTRRTRQIRRPFRPIVTLVVMSILLPAMFIGAAISEGIFETMGDYTDPIINIEDHGTEFDLGETTFFKDGDTLVITTQVNKTDPYVKTYGGSIDYNIFIDGKKYDHMTYAYLPNTDFGVQSVYTTTLVNNFDYDVDSIEVEAVLDTDYEPSITEIDNYDYLTDIDNPSDQQILQAYESDKNIQLEIINDSTSSQDGYVKFKAATKDGSKEYISGYYNILFKKDGKVIFSDEDHYSSVHGQDQSVEVNYHAPIDLPEYDEVEIIDLG